MDTHYLRQFEEVAGVAARAAFAVEDFRGTDATWGVAIGSVYESMGSVADRLARVAGAFPGDPHYVRGKTGELLTAASQLFDKVMMTPVCAMEIPIGVGDDGTYIASECLRPPQHAAEHSARSATNELASHAHKSLGEVVTLVSQVRWAALSEAIDSEDRDELVAGIAQVRHTLEQLARLVDKASQLS